jgi:hypothetical protein
VAQAAALVKENIENQGPTYDEYDDDDMDDDKNCSGDSTKAMACMDEEKDDGVGPYVNSDEESGPMKKQGGQNIDFQLKNIISQNPEGQQ